MSLLYNLFFAADQLRHMHALQTFTARVQAQSLNSFIKAFRNVYQEIFIQEHISLNEKNIKLLPVSTTPKISKKFAKFIAEKANIRTVSDRPRNPKNMANRLEMQTIDYFKKHPASDHYEQYIDQKDDQIFYYATPLRITKRCLVCHGAKENAPRYIRTHYDSAYGYKIGDLRGIIAIYLSQDEIKSQISSIVSRNIYTILLITLIFLFLFYFLLRNISEKEQEYTQKLETEVDEKTKALTHRTQELQHRLYHDPLTELPNRKALIDNLSSQNVQSLALVNIDDFNQINDFYGHETGDRLIKEMAQLLQAYCIDTQRCACRVYRMPSDEYALLFLQTLPHASFKECIEHLISCIGSHTFDQESNPLHLRITVGASGNRDDLLVTADMAMKKAKIERKSYIIYNDDLDLSSKYKENLNWVENLKKALQEDRVVPFLQPIASVQEKKTVIYEALIRIVDEDGTIHAPYEFLDIAKRTRYYPELTKRMADHIFALFKEIPQHISINISYLDIINKETMSYLMEKIQSCAEAKRLHIEILESEGIERFEDVHVCLQKLKSLGCSISLDDFGSGYSNFEHILKLNVDMLKIDGSLIKNIDVDIGSQIIVETIVDFANKLNISTCAEFVSSEEIYEIVKELGVTYIQGFYIGKPIPYNDIQSVNH